MAMSSTSPKRRPYLDDQTWFEFPALREQTGSQWMGGGVIEAMSRQQQVFIEHGVWPDATTDFARSVNTEYLFLAFELIDAER